MALPFSTTGKGKQVFLVEITGVAVLSTRDYTPTDDWYVDGGWSTVYPWLVYKSIDPLQDDIDYTVCRCKTKNMRLEVADVAGGFTALIKDYRGWSHTFLTSTLSEGQTIAAVENTDTLTASGVVYAGQEVFGYDSKDATNLIDLTRGMLGTEDQEHYVNLDAEYLVRVPVSQGAHSIIGRRAIVYSAEIDEGTGLPGPTSVVYRGRISSGAKVGEAVWSIELKHVIDAFYNGSAGNDFDEAEVVQGCWYSGSTNPQAPGNSSITLKDSGLAVGIRAVQRPVITQGWYSPAQLAAEWNGRTDLLFSTWVDFLIEESGGKYSISMIAAGSSTGNEYADIIVRRGDPLNFLGWDEGRITLDLTNPVEADNEPMKLAIDFSGGFTGDVLDNPEVYVEDADSLVDGAYVMVPGMRHAKIESIATSPDIVTLDLHSLDRTQTAGWPTNQMWIIPHDGDPIMRHVLPLGAAGADSSINDAIERLLGIEPGQVEPARWCAQGIRQEDFDWDEYNAVVHGSIPDEIRRVITTVTTATEPYKVIGQHMALLGICLRITDDSKIGFTRLFSPTNADAMDVHVDSEVWANATASKTQALFDGTSLLNEVKVNHSFNYIANDAIDDVSEWGFDLKLRWKEGNKVLGQTRAITYECPGLNIREHSWFSVSDIVAVLNSQVIATHFGIFGREHSIVDIPCTPKARQFRCGDVVKLTHELVPDTVEGEIGVATRVGLVVGRKLHLVGKTEDTLMVLIGPDLNHGGIAPCAHGTAWNQGTKTVTFSTADTPLYAPSGLNDLDEFVNADDAMQVTFIRRDTTTLSTWSGVIVAGGVDTSAKTAVLLTDLFSTGFPAEGVYMLPRDWDDAWDEHKDFAFVADAAVVPTLGSEPDEGFVWTI